MADIAKIRLKIRKSRHKRIRRIIYGTSQRPRFCVRRSLGHIYAHMVDDELGRALFQLSSQSKDIRENTKGKSKVEVSRMVGKKIGEAALQRGISKCAFDRGGYLYHGRIKALADSAREAGLKF